MPSRSRESPQDFAGHLNGGFLILDNEFHAVDDRFDSSIGRLDALYGHAGGVLYLADHLLNIIVTEAAANDVFVWIDMEDATTTGDTLEVFTDLAATHPWTVGQCLQSNLKRTQADLERIIDVPGKVRLVKGAYNEGSSISYTDKSRVDEAYRDNIEYLFANRDRGIAVGSHDMEMIDLARDFGSRTGANYEIQMLMGVRNELQSNLAADGVTMWQYAPYGGKWLSYFYRRVRERKENAPFALRAIIGN